MSRLHLRLTAVVVLSCLALLANSSVRSQEERAADERNPYLAPAGLNEGQLVSYLEKMQKKPKSLRSREGFIEAAIDASERVLQGQPNDEQRTVAALHLFDTLYGQAVLGNPAADEKLFGWAEKLQDAAQEPIARRADLHLLEKRVMEARKIELTQEQRQKLLGQIKEYFEQETKDGKLQAHHLRLGSETIGLINGLEDADQKSKLFDEIGGLLAKTDNPELARYAKGILKKPGDDAPGADLVGQELELAGVPVDGGEFDWSSYRGKIVLVDFWATWCGPCIRELPNVQAAYEKHHDKGFEVVAISLDDDKDELAKFIEEKKITWVNLHDKSAEAPLAKKYGIRAIPTALLVDRDGKVIAANMRGEKLEQQLEKLLGKGEPTKKIEKPMPSGDKPKAKSEPVQ